MTREETIKAFECCYMTHNCEGCPFEEQGEWECGNGGPELNKAVIHYLKENEPALSANSTSSTKKENTFQIDDSTKEQICQAYKTADEACSNILTVYEGISECEQRAFDIGEAYGKIFDTRCKLEELRGGDGNEH
jgi:hypothetical protein